MSKAIDILNSVKADYRSKLQAENEAKARAAAEIAQALREKYRQALVIRKAEFMMEWFEGEIRLPNGYHAGKFNIPGHRDIYFGYSHSRFVVLSDSDNEGNDPSPIYYDSLPEALIDAEIPK